MTTFEKNQSDKTLLELAAKASGIPNEMWLYKWWNPLTDNGDAFCLAVKLRMNVYVDTHTVVAEICSDSDCPNIHQKVFIQEDEYVSTRRAIVRAAAAIGETM